MATKWKNTEIWKEIAVMAGFLLAMVLLFGLLLAAIFWKSSSGIEMVSDRIANAVQTDIRRTAAYHQMLDEIADQVAESVQKRVEYANQTTHNIHRETAVVPENVSYQWVCGEWSGGNTQEEIVLSNHGQTVVNYHWDGETSVAYLPETQGQEPEKDPFNWQPSLDWEETFSMRIVVDNRVSTPVLEEIQAQCIEDRQLLAVFSGMVLLIVLGLLLLLFLRKTLRIAGRKWASRLLPIWVELKLAAAAGLVVRVVQCALANALPVWWELVIWFLVFFLLLTDLFFNIPLYVHGKGSSLLVKLWKLDLPFYRFAPATPPTRRLGVLCLRSGLLFAVLLVIGLMVGWWYPLAVSVGLGVAAVVLLIEIFRWTRRELSQVQRLMTQIAELGENALGSAEGSAITVEDPQSSCYEPSQQLQQVQSLVQKAVEEGVRSERMKLELITNVSHDLKTPLTSIISYVELLRQEPGLSSQVQEYLSVVAAKADRLKTMVQDVFDLSKATSGNLPLYLETLDLSRLLRQTLADMDDAMQESPYIWKVRVPEEPFPIQADGQRLYRVFQNLLKNALQYAMENTRVYLKLEKEGSQAVFSLKNVSRFELPEDAQALTERFVRGDASRSTEGSGLGLSIAKSYTELCGGDFQIEVNGDLFSVTLRFPLEEKDFPEAWEPADA